MAQWRPPTCLGRRGHTTWTSDWTANPLKVSTPPLRVVSPRGLSTYNREIGRERERGREGERGGRGGERERERERERENV